MVRIKKEDVYEIRFIADRIVKFMIDHPNCIMDDVDKTFYIDFVEFIMSELLIEDQSCCFPFKRPKKKK
jgi:hypothetical protein